MREPYRLPLEPRELLFYIQQLIRGRSNSVGEVTLTDNVASTTVTLATELGNSDAKVFLTPTTANAAAEFANGTLYVSSVTGTGFVITHANNAQTDRTYHYDVRGG